MTRPSSAEPGPEPEPGPGVAPGAGKVWRATVLGVLRRPGLYGTAIQQVFLLAPRGWWRRWPPLPTPAQGWLEFRRETQYGNPDAPLDPDDVVAWLEWCRAQRQESRPGT
jgi:hypothetical protein